MKLSAQISVFSGAFASQPLAFAHILDSADAQGLSLDLDHIEVVKAPYVPRLSAWFTLDVCAKITASVPPSDTLIVVLPGANGPLNPTQLLRLLGQYPGTIIRAPIPRQEV